MYSFNLICQDPAFNKERNQYISYPCVAQTLFGRHLGKRANAV